MQRSRLLVLGRLMAMAMAIMVVICLCRLTTQTHIFADSAFPVNSVAGVLHCGMVADFSSASFRSFKETASNSAQNTSLNFLYIHWNGFLSGGS
jgi:hypothetical protein